MRKALKQTIEGGKNTAMRRNQLKKRKIKPRSGIKLTNMVDGKRVKEKGKPRLPTFVPPPEPPIGTATNIDELFEEEADRMRKDKVEKSRSKF